MSTALQVKKEREREKQGSLQICDCGPGLEGFPQPICFVPLLSIGALPHLWDPGVHSLKIQGKKTQTIQKSSLTSRACFIPRVPFEACCIIVIKYFINWFWVCVSRWHINSRRTGREAAPGLFPGVTPCLEQCSHAGEELEHDYFWEEKYLAIWVVKRLPWNSNLCVFLSQSFFNWSLTDIIVYQFQVYNVLICCLPALWNDRGSESTYHLTPYKVTDFFFFDENC